MERSAKLGLPPADRGRVHLACGVGVRCVPLRPSKPFLTLEPEQCEPEKREVRSADKMDGSTAAGDDSVASERSSETGSELKELHLRKTLSSSAKGALGVKRETSPQRSASMASSPRIPSLTAALGHAASRTLLRQASGPLTSPLYAYRAESPVARAPPASPPVPRMAPPSPPVPRMWYPTMMTQQVQPVQHLLQPAQMVQPPQQRPLPQPLHLQPVQLQPRMSQQMCPRHSFMQPMNPTLLHSKVRTSAACRYVLAERWWL